jgi:hypothetical protein
MVKRAMVVLKLIWHCDSLAMRAYQLFGRHTGGIFEVIGLIKKKDIKKVMRVMYPLGGWVHFNFPSPPKI